MSAWLRSWQSGVAAFAVLVLAIAYRASSVDFFGTSQEGIAGYRLPQYSMLTPSFVKSIVPLTLLAMVLGF
ncbi:MAG TPA: hypothetical protein VFS77_19315, partial [Pyrinomonadaceae bacterium]|nr:hypothetical protein [Pyrinomonadaceae bacterium]